MDIAEFNIPNMTCGSCAEKIKTALTNVGVTEISFDFKTRNASVTYDNQKIGVADIKKIISNAGYEVI